jgi:nucleoside phosphorylase
MGSRGRRLSHNDYTVACICPMGVELAAVEGMLDEIHENLPSSRDQNGYTLGRIGRHNIVVAVMPAIGNHRAASVAIQLLNDFRSIRFGLLVGIGGGVPGEEEDDIRLGDVVISKPTATFGGVVQYDMGKITVGGILQRTGTLKPPPTVLIANVERLQAQQIRSGSQIPRYLATMLEKYPNMRKKQYKYQGEKYDQLFKATYDHEGGITCRNCDQTKLVERLPRDDTDPEIHYGTIGSGNTVIKDGRTRERLRKDLGVLCVEMEAAGLMDEFSCLVIRGICDYADSHKDKRWQPYAAATAAAYAKELLSIIPAQEVVATTKAADALQMSRGTPDL